MVCLSVYKKSGLIRFLKRNLSANFQILESKLLIHFGIDCLFVGRFEWVRFNCGKYSALTHYCCFGHQALSESETCHLWNHCRLYNLTQVNCKFLPYKIWFVICVVRKERRLLIRAGAEFVVLKWFILLLQRLSAEVLSIDCLVSF